jgi:ATP-dependent Zn protease
MKRPRSLFKRRERTGVVKADRAVCYDPNNPRYVATHEAGHAVSAIVLDLDLKSVDIKRRRLPEGISLGLTDTRKVGLDEVAGKGEEVALPLLIQLLTGSSAESMVNPHLHELDGHIKDLEDARRIAVAAICELTTRPDGLMEVTREEQQRHRPRLEALFESAASAAERLVREHWSAIETVTSLLIERKQLSGDEVAAIVNSHRPDPVATRVAV